MESGSLQESGQESVRDRQRLSTLRKTTLLLGHCPFDALNSTRIFEKNCKHLRQENKYKHCWNSCSAKNICGELKQNLFPKKKCTHLGNLTRSTVLGFPTSVSQLYSKKEQKSRIHRNFKDILLKIIKNKSGNRQEIPEQLR